MRKLLALTDMDESGSGYRNICVRLFSELSELGYDIKVAGLMYRGGEHRFPFGIIPAGGLDDAKAICNNLIYLWQPEAVLVAMDIPLQIALHQFFRPFGKKYIALTALENGPLTMSWAFPMFDMDAVFFISELGKREAVKAGISRADHFVVGVDTNAFRPPHPEERQKLREGLGIPGDAFVILTVADNQERKNLWAAMEAVKRLKKEIEVPIRYILVTREQSQFGWKLRDLAVSLGINQEYVPFERGIPQEDLWGLYAIADVYLQTSKAEGLGMPVLEAMACGVPVVATDTGGLHELLEDERGFLIPSDYDFIDVWGNSLRRMVNISEVVSTLRLIHSGRELAAARAGRALDYIRSRSWSESALRFHESIRRFWDEQA